MPANPLDTFLDLACGEMTRRALLQEPTPGVLRQGAEAFRRALATAQVIGDGEPLSTVPALAELSSLPEAELTEAAIAASEHVPWIPTPRLRGDDGASVALGLVDRVRDLGDVQCGLMLLGAGAAYPVHAHPPQEIYLPIAGDGRWRYGGMREYRSVSDDMLVYNNPRDVHSAIAGTDPLLAMYILWPQ